MEAEEAGRAVRTVHEAAAHALERLEGIDNVRAEADAKLALLGGLVDEFSASMRSVLPVWAEMASGGFRCSYPGDPEHLWVALGAFLALNEDRAETLVDKRFRIRDLIGCLKRELTVALAELDPPIPQPEAGTSESAHPSLNPPLQQPGAGASEGAGSSGLIGSRPPGPAFHEYVPEGERHRWNRFRDRGREYAEAVAEEQREIPSPPELNSAHSVPGTISGPYDDLREPWYRRLVRRNRGRR
ncbi:hypothetical protein [Streptomyces sp. OR43]|uniref:hypothetical protein n=1 Tax=Streptomyces sp. or43 TaxID=2478957 RepID=UPI0011CDAB72|nr:hypothetical protein [Streptomyces sp. or43]